VWVSAKLGFWRAECTRSTTLGALFADAVGWARGVLGASEGGEGVVVKMHLLGEVRTSDMSTYLPTLSYIYIYIYIYRCVYVYIYIHTYTHTRTHTYIHMYV